MEGREGVTRADGNASARDYGDGFARDARKPPGAGGDADVRPGDEHVITDPVGGGRALHASMAKPD